MFRLRKEHMAAFQKDSARNFETRMAAHLRSCFTSKLAGTSDDQLKNLIRCGTEKSKQYGVVGESDIRRYLEYIMEYGEDFDTNPNMSWAKQILTAENKTGTWKMDNLDSFAMFELRE